MIETGAEGYCKRNNCIVMRENGNANKHCSKQCKNYIYEQVEAFDIHIINITQKIFSINPEKKKRRN